MMQEENLTAGQNVAVGIDLVGLGTGNMTMTEIADHTTTRDSTAGQETLTARTTGRETHMALMQGAVPRQRAEVRHKLPH